MCREVVRLKKRRLQLSGMAQPTELSEGPRWPIAIASWKDQELLVEIAVPAVALQLFEYLLGETSPITDLAVPFHISHRPHPGDDC